MECNTKIKQYNLVSCHEEIGSYYISLNKKEKQTEKQVREQLI